MHSILVLPSRKFVYHIIASSTLLALFVGLVIFAPYQPGAWSKPQLVAESSRYYEYQSQSIDDSIIAAMVVSNEGKTSIETHKFFGSRVQETFSVAVRDMLAYMLVSNGSNYAVVWAERSADQSIFYVHSPIIPKTMLQVVQGMVDGVSATYDSLGKLILAWMDNSTGLQSVYIRVFNPSLEPEGETVHVTPSGLPVLQHRLVVSEKHLHVIYKAKNQIFTDVLHQTIGLEDLDPTPPLRIRRVASDSVELPACLELKDGAVTVYWVQDTQLRGSGRSTVIMNGQIDKNGTWRDAPSELLELNGHSTGLRASQSPHNSVDLVLANDQSGSFQIYTVDENLQVAQATYGSIQRFAPNIHWLGNKRTVMYQELLRPHATLWVTSFLPEARIPLALRLGLTSSTPMLDLAFKVITLLAATAAYGLVASFAVLLAVGLVVLSGRWLTASSKNCALAQHISLYMLLALLKGYGGQIYYGAVRVPGTVGAFIALGSAVFAWGAVKLLNLNRTDVLALGISGFMWVWADAYCSFFVRGGGLW